MKNKLLKKLFPTTSVCEHKDTIIFVITKIVIYLYLNYLRLSSNADMNPCIKALKS